MPFDLKMLQDVFQMWMDQITNRLPGIIGIHDNICVYGKDTTEHDNKLPKLMQTAQEQGLVFNSSKCSICHPQIHSTRYEARSCKGTSFARPSHPPKP